MDAFEIWDNWELLLSRIKGKGMNSEFEKLIDIQNQAFGELEKIEKVSSENGEKVCAIGNKSLIEYDPLSIAGGQLFGKVEIGDASVFPHCIFINIIGRIENSEGTLFSAEGIRLPMIFRFNDDSPGNKVLESLIAEIPLFYDWMEPKIQKVKLPLCAERIEQNDENEDLYWFNLLKERIETDQEKLVNLLHIRQNAWNEMHNSKIMLMGDSSYLSKYVQMSDQDKLDEKFKNAKSIGRRYVTEVRELTQNPDGSISGPIFQVVNAASFPFCTALHIQGCLEKSLRFIIILNKSETVVDCLIEILNENNEDVSQFKENIMKLDKMYPKYSLNIDSDAYSKHTEKTEECEMKNGTAPETIKDERSTPEVLTDSLDQMLLSQLIAFYLDTSEEKYIIECTRRLIICGFTKLEITSYLAYESEIILKNKKKELLDINYIYGWCFDLHHAVYKESMEHYISNRAFLSAEIIKMWDEAEWHIANSHDRQDVTNDAWNEIYKMSKLGDGFLIKHIEAISKNAGINFKKIHKLTVCEQRIISIYKWKYEQPNYYKSSAVPEQPKESYASKKRYENGLLGFTSGKWYKKLIAIAYLSCIFVFFSVAILSSTEYSNQLKDIVLDKLQTLSMFSIPILPYLILSNVFGIRDKLPIFKKKKAILNVLGIIVISLILVIVFGFLNSLHTQEYKAAQSIHSETRQAERV